MKTNPKRFWSRVISLKASGPVPDVMIFNEQQLTNKHAIAKAFGAYFKSVFQFSENVTLAQCPYRNVPVF